MSNFAGYLLKFGSKELPNKYIVWEGVTTSPDMRTEAEAWRNANNELQRSTYTKYTSKIEFNTREGLTDDDIAEMYKIMSTSLENEVEQKYKITYWDDKTGTYKSGSFYLSDPSFKIKKIVESPPQIIYKSIRFAFIEY